LQAIEKFTPAQLENKETIEKDGKRFVKSIIQKK